MKKVLGAAIRRLRKKHGLTQAQLASAANIHRVYLGDIERGRSNVTLKVLIDIARRLQTTLTGLFQDVPDQR